MIWFGLSIDQAMLYMISLLPTPRYPDAKFQRVEEIEDAIHIHYLTRGFFAPRLKISTSVLFRGIIGFTPPGAGLDVRDGGPELIRGVPEEAAFGLEIIEEMTSDGFGAERAADNGGEAEEACDRGFVDGCDGREEDAGLLERCRERGGFSERGGEEEDAWGRDEGRSSKRSSTSSKSSSSSSEDPTNICFKPPFPPIFGGDVRALSFASLSSNDGLLIPVIPPENVELRFCFLDSILTAGWFAF